MMRRSLYSLAFKRVIKVVSKRPASQVSSGVTAAAASQGSAVPNAVDRNVTMSAPVSSASPSPSAQQPISPPQPSSSAIPPTSATPTSQQPISQSSQGTTTSTTNEITDPHITHVPRKKIIKKIIKKKKIHHGSSSPSTMPSSKVTEASASAFISQASSEELQQQEEQQPPSQHVEEQQEQEHEEMYHAEVRKSEMAQEGNKMGSVSSKVINEPSHNTQHLYEEEEELQTEQQQELETQEYDSKGNSLNNDNSTNKQNYPKNKTEGAFVSNKEEEMVKRGSNAATSMKTNLFAPHNMRGNTPEDMPAEPTIIPVRTAHASSSSNAHSLSDASGEIKKAAKKSRIRVSTGQDLYDELRAPSGSYNRTHNNSSSSSSSSSISHKNNAGGNKASTKSDTHDKSSSSSRSNAAGTNTSTTTSGGKKTPMVKGFRVDEVLSICGPGDAVFARRLPSGGCQFFAWPGTPLSIASSAIVSMPDTIRTVHAVFGRTKVPIDLVMDVDCPVPQEEWSMSRIRPYQQKVLDDTLTVVKEELDKIGVEIETQVVLQSPNLKKASFHIHTKLKDVAFEDYESLHGFLARFRSRIPYVDLQIYRTHGMLRMFSCMKENRTSAMVVFDDPKWNIGFANGQVPDEAAALHSVCVREPGTFSRLLKFDPPRMAPYGMHMNSDNDGNNNTANNNYNNGNGEQDGFKPVPVLLPRTEKEAIENASMWLRSATEAEVTEWRSWIALGLCAYRIAHHFKDASTLPRPAMEVMLEAWVEASRHCPQKFKHGDCEARWASFDITKMKYDSNWWSAYQHLGRLSVPAQHAIAEENKREAERLARYKQYKPAN